MISNFIAWISNLLVKVPPTGDLIRRYGRTLAALANIKIIHITDVVSRDRPHRGGNSNSIDRAGIEPGVPNGLRLTRT